MRRLRAATSAGDEGMSTSPHEQSQHAPHNAPPPAPATPRPGGSADDVLGVLNEFEQGLESLKKLYGERKAILAALEARESELANRELDADRREQDVAARKSEVEALQQQVAGLANELKEREQSIAAQREELQRAQNDAGARAAELDALDRAIAERAATQATEAKRTAAELDAKMTELRSAAAALAEQREQAEQNRQKLAALMDELPKREARIAESTAAIEKERSLLTSARTELNAAQDALRAERETARQSEAHEIARLTSLLQRAETAAGEMGKRAEHAATQAETMAARAAALEQQLSAVQTSAQQSSSSRDAELAEARARLGGLERELKNAQTRCADIEARLAESDAKATQFAATLDAAKQTAIAAGDAARREQHELEQVLDQLRERLKSEAARADDATRRVSELDDLMNAPGGTESALRIECDRLNEELAQTRNQLANRPASVAAGPVDAPWLVGRRARLSRARRLLIDQTRKVRRAGEVLHKRFEQCEQILAQRVELAAAKRAVDQATRSLASREAKAKSGSIVLMSVFVIAILGALSWFAAGQFFPGQFVSRAVVAADGKGRDLAPDELKEWQTFHESLVKDPRFMELAADRMNQRGIAALAQPGAVQQLVNSSISTSSNTDGELTIELRGEGPTRVQRILDTFAIAVASQANATRDRRADGGVTVIKETASLPGAPLDNQRVVYAAILWACASFLALLVGLVLWKQLAAAKARFEQSNQVDAILDEAHWPKLDR